jgi:osmoprotectant transport system substrate-binding protein
MKMMSMRTRREPMTGPTARLRAVPAAVALMAVLAACGGAEDSATPAAPVAPAGPGSGVADGPTIVTRGQDFSEARTLAKVYALYLEGLGYPVEVLTAAGFRTEAIAALEAGQLGLIVDYIGGSLTALAPDAASSADADAIMEVIRPAYAQLGARVLQYAPAIDGDALIVRGDYDAVTISDLAGRGAVFGAAAQCFERPQCYLGLTDPSIYGITFGSTRTIEFGPLLGEALRAGEVDAVIWNDTAPQIGVEGFRVLIDDRGLFPAQNIAPILSEVLIAAYGDALVAAIDALSARITTADLVAWNVETDLEFREPIDVAREWLQAQGLLG